VKEIVGGGLTYTLQRTLILGVEECKRTRKKRGTAHPSLKPREAEGGGGGGGEGRGGRGKGGER